MQRFVAIGVLAVGVLAGGFFFLNRGGDGTGGAVGLPNAASAQTSEVDTSAVTEMVKGSEDAPITLIEYGSFSCPACQSFHFNGMPTLQSDYIDTGLVRFVYREAYRNLPDLWASMVARCGTDDRFFGVVDVLYENQAEWWADGVPATISNNLRQIGLSVGLSQEELQVCLSDSETALTLMTWYEENADRHNVQGTPTFVINDRKVSISSYQDLWDALDRAAN